MQLKQLDAKFSEFENAAIQREKDYRTIIEQQRLDSEQLKGFEKLKDANLELRAVSACFVALKCATLINLK